MCVCGSTSLVRVLQDDLVLDHARGGRAITDGLTRINQGYRRVRVLDSLDPPIISTTPIIQPHPVPHHNPVTGELNLEQDVSRLTTFVVLSMQGPVSFKTKHYLCKTKRMNDI